MRAVRVALVGALVIAGAVSAAPASAGTTHRVATANYTYLAPMQVILVGDSLNHTNEDSVEHNVVSNESGPDGKPWFDSPLIGAGETAAVPVEGVPPGTYRYTCSIHPFMQGTLDIREPTAPPPAGSGEIEVSAGDNFFAPKALTVAAGTTVRWKNTGADSHTVTARDGSWDSSPACPQVGDGCWMPGQTFSHTFNSTGLFFYYCKLHGTPGGGGQSGSVQVVPPGSLSTAVGSLSASAAGTEVSVSGSATFRGEAPVSVSQDPAGDGPVVPGLADETGVDLVAAKAYQPDPASPVLFFEWHLTGLPAHGSLPDAVRYTLPFRIGTRSFQLQAKLTDLASPGTAGNPSDHASRSGNAFELRADCTAVGPAVGTCSHIAWLNGSFDSLHDLVRVKVPLGAAPEIVPGAELARNEAAASDLVRIQAGYQAVAATAADEADWGGQDAGFTYRVPTRQVLLGIAPPGTPQAAVPFETPATVGADGSSFSGSVSAPGPGSWDVWVKACFGTNCGQKKVTLNL